MTGISDISIPGPANVEETATYVVALADPSDQVESVDYAFDDHDQNRQPRRHRAICHRREKTKAPAA